MSGAGASGSPIAWLLEGDPAVRWQVLADVLDAPADEVRAERGRVSTQGWGARLLAAQDADGLWAGALYSPKWTSTTYTLLLLHWLGLESSDPNARRGCERLLASAREVDDGLVLGEWTRSDACVTAMLVLLSVRFGGGDDRTDRAVERLAGKALPDGGWNCRADRGATHGSFHTTISVLDAFQEYVNAGGRHDVSAAMENAREFLLAHRLFRSHRTGEVVADAFTRSHFPPQWHFDVVRGLEHFRAAGAARDERLTDAISIIQAAQRSDGTWTGHAAYAGRYWFPFDAQDRSRWATLRALRLLRWWAAAPVSN